MEGFPARKRGIHNIDKLVYTPEKQPKEWVGAEQLEPGMWSVDHSSLIANVFPAASGQGFRVVLENGVEFPIDRGDGLDIARSQP